MYPVRTPYAKSPSRLFRAITATHAAARRTQARSLRLASVILLALGVAFTSLATAQTAHFVDAESLVRSGLGLPFAVALDTAGKIYVANYHTNQILIETPSVDGYLETSIGSGLNGPSGVAVDPQGNVYIADTENHRVLKETLSNAGYTQSVIGSGFLLPADIAVDTSGNLFITDDGLQTVVKETAFGNIYTQTTALTGLNYPTGIVVDASGDLFIADTNNARVLKAKPSGSGYTQSTIGSGYGEPAGVAIDQHGNLYIVDQFPAKLWKLTVSGSTYTQSQVPVVSYLEAPEGVAVDPLGNIYLSDEGSSATAGFLFKEMPAGGNFGFVSVGVTSPDIGVMFQFDTGGTVSNVAGVTQGASNKDFINPGNPSCYQGSTYKAAQECVANATFTPTAAGSRTGAISLLDNSGNTFATAYLSGTGVAPEVTFQVIGDPGTQTVIPWSSAGESSPYAIAVDTTGSIYIADSNSNRVLKETLSGGIYTESTIGSGLNSPAQMAVDGRGNVYIADTGNGRVVKETLNGSAYTQSVINTGYSSPNGVAVDNNGNVYVADTLNDRVLKLTLNTNAYTQSVLPTTGLSTVFGLAVDAEGSVYIADTGNGRIVKETPFGTSYTQSVVDSGLNNPFGVTVDGFGNVYISQFNAGYLIEESPLAAGGYSESFPPTTGLSAPYGIAVDSLGNVYVSDVGNEQVYKEDYADAPTHTFNSTNIGVASSDSPIYVKLLNIGNAPLYFPAPATGTNPSVPTNFTLNSSAFDACPLTPAGAMGAGMINADTSCILALGFTPTASGFMSGSLTITDDSLYAAGPGYATQSISLFGRGLISQTITFPLPVSPIYYPQSPVTLVATGGGSGNPVVFSLVSGPGSLSGINNSVLTITGVGTIIVATNQAGNATYSAANPVIQNIVVNPSPAAVLTSPTPGIGTKLGAANVTFQWTTGTGATLYQLNLSAVAPGNSELFTYKGTATSAIAATLPANNVTVYATLYSKVNGVWLSNSYLYTESGTPTPAALTSPTPGLGTILGAANVAFHWTAGTDVTQYQLNLSAVAAGNTDLYTYKGTAITATAPTLPANGVKVFARLYSKINAAWQYNDYVYTESGTPTPATLTSPTPGLGTTLGTTNVAFQWTKGTSVTNYQLNLSAIAAGQNELYTYKGTALTTTAPTLPGNGAKVYARLYSDINGVWQYNDYVYTEGGTPTPAALTSPTPGLGTMLGTSSVKFQWTAGIAVSDYELTLSAVAAGGSELFLYKGTALTATAPTLPANGVKVYARLYSFINGVWQHNDYVYTEQ